MALRSQRPLLWVDILRLLDPTLRLGVDTESNDRLAFMHSCQNSRQYELMTASSSSVGLQLVSLLVRDYDEAIAFFVSKLGFDLVADDPATASSGIPKRWVVVRPPGNPNGCGVLLAKCEGQDQLDVLQRQFGGRVGLFWRVEDFDATYARLMSQGIEFVRAPKTESYGRVVVFKDISGNKWDLLGP